MIELKNITKEYVPNQKALSDVNLHIKEGELVVLKGASGSGKSTMLSLIAALGKPTTGEVVVDNKVISKLPDNFAALYRREHIGFIFQKFHLIENLSVYENIATPLIPSNLAVEDFMQLVAFAMNRFEIEHKKDVLVKQLSGGEQQRVAIARANVNNPKIILADEPTANLDAKLSANFIEILKELKKDGKTIVVATHDPLFFGLDFVDREVEVKNGVIV